MAQHSDPVLHVDNLSISYKVGRRWIPAVRDFQLEVCPGQIYGVVGESGSGKSTAAAGIMRYLPANGRIEPGSRVAFLGEDLAPKSRRAMERIWGAQMGLVPQDPGGALNPSIRVGEQVAEILRRHTTLDRAAARERTVEMFRRVQLADPDALLTRYPHELSGGMQQRVLIAMSLATSPRLLLLDEPTTALDVTTEAIILDLVRNLIAAEGAGAIYVTHNLGVVAQLCERVVVLYAGEIMEDATVAELFAAPRHPYTIGLLNSIPRLGQTKRDAALQAIAGRPPSLAELPRGCVYAPRCPLAIEICRTKPPLEAPAEGRLVRCHRWQEIARGEVSLREQAQAGIEDAAPVTGDREELLEVTDLTKHFPVQRGLRNILRGEHPAPVRAVDGVNLGVQKGRTLGLVGESGSGKTTLARVIIGLTDRTGGEIELMGIDVPGTVRDRDKSTLAQLQMVFQNPQNSLNPYLTVGQALRRPLIKLAKVAPDAVDAEIRRLLTEVNLRPEYADRYPGELSGGEKQRVAIARAFASNPALILCDEPVSSLDVSVQAAVLNLLARLQAEHDTSYLFISHDLAVVGYLADYLVVMYLGVIYEVGYGSDLFRPPYHPYTEALVSAIPRPNPDAHSARVRLSGDIPSPRDIPTGCRFHTRCPHKVGAICEQEEPPWRDDGSGHFIRCHRELWDLAERQQATRIEEED
ncbi:MAG TPA: ABC transporter ATP-binding protein [Aggregatilinea sp.]|uniref:ABC transporter ATP-binding protein n=1 Tax=Aggregatilinea sp. TaxID=2806333 RepID=UPI002BFF5D5B|nr:ABC transporter ATP-binding protein [Aggregatilinea sp.]HML24209.1 ABC transporter ATP-binding protein [Aggregatilinea sp.]